MDFPISKSIWDINTPSRTNRRTETEILRFSQKGNAVGVVIKVTFPMNLIDDAPHGTVVLSIRYYFEYFIYLYVIRYIKQPSSQHLYNSLIKFHIQQIVYLNFLIPLSKENSRYTIAIFLCTKFSFLFISCMTNLFFHPEN